MVHPKKDADLIAAFILSWYSVRQSHQPVEKADWKQSPLSLKLQRTEREW